MSTATIIQTNATALRTLGVLDAVFSDPTTLYNAYAARVTADGGAVIDATACQAAITAAFNGGYLFSVASAVSARWGVKKSGSTVSKLYSLYGTNDATTTGTVTWENATQAWPTLQFANGVPVINFPSMTVTKNGYLGVASVETSTAGTAAGGQVSVSENTSGVTALAIGTAGSGGTPGTYPLVFTGGGGSGAAGTATVNGSGIVSAVAVTAQGSGYTSTPAITIPSATGLTGEVINPTVAAITDLYRTGALRLFRGTLDKLDANPGHTVTAKDGQAFWVDAAGITYILVNGADIAQAQTPQLTSGLTGTPPYGNISGAQLNVSEIWILNDPTHNHMRTLTSDQYTRHH